MTISDRGAIRVLLVEDHRVVLEGLRALLREQPGITVVGEAGSGEDAVQLAEAAAPDVVIMDLAMPGIGGIEAIRRLRRSRPAIQIVVLSMHDDAATIDGALHAGARGYVLKGRGIASLCDAIRTVHRGEVYLGADVSEYVLQGYLRARDDDAGPLSEREREVVRLIAEGNTSRQIAARLSLKPKTVENHRARIMDKLGIRTTAGIVRWALRTGIAR